MQQRFQQSLAAAWRRKPLTVAAAALVVTGLAGGVAWAATNGIDWAASSVTGNAEVVADSNATSGQAVKFGVGNLVWSDSPASAVGTSAPLTNWQNTSYNIYAGSTVKVLSDAMMGKAIQFYGPANSSSNGSQRGEQVPNIADFQPETTQWIGMSVWLNSGLGIANDWQSIFQVKNDTEGSPALTIYANTHSDGLVLAANRDNTGTPNYYQPIGPTPYNTWTRIVLGLHITKDPTTSWVEVWRDGQNIIPRENWSAYNQANKGPAGGLMYSNATSGYFKFGVYRGPQSWPMDLRMSNVKIGTARGTVQ